MQLDEFKQLLKAHDWAYMMSDDPHVNMAGIRSKEEIISVLDRHPEWMPVYNEARDMFWRGRDA